MAFVTDSRFAEVALSRRRATMARMIGGMLGFLKTPDHEPPPPPLPIGPQAKALVDADYERLASFGSWSALRDELRERAIQPQRKTA